MYRGWLLCCTQLDVNHYTAFAVPKDKGKQFEFVAISDAVSITMRLVCYVES